MLAIVQDLESKHPELEKEHLGDWISPPNMMVMRKNGNGDHVSMDAGDYHVVVKVGGTMRFYGPKGTPRIAPPKFCIGHTVMRRSEMDDGSSDQE